MIHQDRLTQSEYTRLVDWMCDPKRKPANLAFTASSCRDAARAFEDYLRRTGIEEQLRVATDAYRIEVEKSGRLAAELDVYIKGTK